MLKLNEQFISQLPDKVDFDWFMAIKGEAYRDLDGRKTIRFQERGRSYFIKIHTGVGWREIFKNLSQFKWPVLGAKNEYQAIQALTDLSVDTMTLVAYGQRGWNPARLESFVMTEDLVNTISLEDYCADWVKNKPSRRLKNILIDRVADMTRIMHQAGMNHRDLYICHFLLNKDWPKAELKLSIIDLHRVQKRSRVPKRWLIKDLAALFYSAMDIGLGPRDFFRFIRRYSQHSLSAELRNNAGFWRQVQKKARVLYANPVE